MQLSALVQKFESLFLPFWKSASAGNAAHRHHRRTAPPTDVLAAPLAGQGAAARRPRPPTPKPPSVMSEAKPDPAPREDFRTDAKYNANVAAAASGRSFLYDDGGGLQRWVPKLTPAQAAAEAALLRGQTDAGGAALRSGLQTGLKQAPIVGGILAGAVSGDEPLTAAELLRNNANERAMAQVVVIQTDPGQLGGSTKAQLDPMVLDPFGEEEAGVAGRKNDL